MTQLDDDQEPKEGAWYVSKALRYAPGGVTGGPTSAKQEQLSGVQRTPFAAPKGIGVAPHHARKLTQKGKAEATLSKSRPRQARFPHLIRTARG
jgi:hypothetical protein